MKGRVVVINGMYTVCNRVCDRVCKRVCTLAMPNLIEPRRLPGAEGSHLHFVSMTLTRLSDAPEALREFMKRHGIIDRWTFLTGDLGSVEKVQRALGLLSPRDGDDLLSHSGMARCCDERKLRWTHLNTVLPGSSVARTIRFEMV